MCANQYTSPQTIAERFWLKVDVAPSIFMCWNWKSSKNWFGYGKFAKGGKYGGWVHAHRVAWELVNGSIPHGIGVCHHCDNPSCVNPLHLFLGTQKDNMSDANAKGRIRNGVLTHPEKIVRGEQHPSSKLTQLQVNEIRERFSHDNITLKQLGNDYGVGWGAIWKIVHNKRWVQ